MMNKTNCACAMLRARAFIALAVIAWNCSSDPAKDVCCVFTQLITDDMEASNEQGILQVDGSTSAYYYLLDQTGKQLRYQHLNKRMVLDPGHYRVKVNNSLHDISVREGYLASCVSGTLIVSGQTTDSYYVTDSLGEAIAKEKLGSALSFFPGMYKVKVNETEALVEVRANEVTEVRTGSVVAQGPTGENYYVLDRAGRQLNFSRLGKPLAFLPGSYVVSVNNTSMTAEVFPGRKTALATGSLLVHGLTDEFYYVSDTLGNALNFQNLNRALAVFPGTYTIQLNNTRITGEVAADGLTEFSTGCLTLSGAGSGYYYVFDGAGKPLNHNSLNRWLSFFPSEYTVKLGERTRKATIVAGQQTSLDAFQ